MRATLTLPADWMNDAASGSKTLKGVWTGTGSGAAVMVAGRNAEKNAAAVAELRALGAEADATIVDVTEEASVNAMVAATAARFGRLDILVNNAGINIRNRPEVYDLADWHKVIATNLTSAMLASKAAHPYLKASGHGRVINNGSMLSIFGLPFHAAYGASKGGVVQMTKSMAVAWAADGITVNCLLPGWIDTDLTRKARTDMAGLNDNVLARTPKGRWGDPGDFEGVRAIAREVPGIVVAALARANERDVTTAGEAVRDAERLRAALAAALAVAVDADGAAAAAAAAVAAATAARAAALQEGNWPDECAQCYTQPEAARDGPARLPQLRQRQLELESNRQARPLRPRRPT
jgi:2-deoxy-D-gluconate 3-dehydrogenase